jgi:hypothetical protein
VVFDETQLLVPVTTCVELSENRAVAASVVFPPRLTDEAPDTATDDSVGGGGGATAVTCTANAGLVMPWKVAVILAEPADAPVTTPELETVATALFVDDQVLLPVTTCLELSEKRAVAVRLVVADTPIDEAPVIATDDSVGAVGVVGGAGVVGESGVVGAALTWTANAGLAMP